MQRSELFILFRNSLKTFGIMNRRKQLMNSFINPLQSMVHWWVGFESLESWLIRCYFCQMNFDNSFHRLIYSQIITSWFGLLRVLDKHQGMNKFHELFTPSIFFSPFLFHHRLAAVSLQKFKDFFFLLGVFCSENSIDHRSLPFSFKFT